MRPKQRYIPKGCGEEVTREGVPAVVYVDRDRTSAIAYRGRAVRPAWNYMFKNSAQMEEYIDQFFADVAAREESKRKRAEERRAYRPALKPGDVLHTSWGYEQTNVEFFEVVAVKGRRVTVCEIAQEVTETGFMSGRARPVRGEFVGEPLTRIAQPGDTLKIDQVRYAWPVEGREDFHCSWYA